MSQKIPLSEMIETLREELEEAQKKAKKSDLKFVTESVELELSVAVSKTGTGKGGIKFWVIEAGGEYERTKETTHKFTLKLKPKSQLTGGPISVSEESNTNVSND